MVYCVMASSLWDYINLFNTIELDTISRDYEITRATSKYGDGVVLARVEGSKTLVYSNLLSSRRALYRVLGVGDDVSAYKKILEAMGNPSKPCERSFNDYFRKVEWSLWDIPFIKYYRVDGGYYLTGSVIVSCIDSVCNASFHRMMYRDEYSATVRIVERHLYRIYSSYMEEGEDTPVAVVLGTHPIVEIASASSPPYGVYELWVANRMLDNGLEIAYTPLYNIPVPVDTAIILEGRLLREHDWEGPFTDILRIADKKRKQPVFKLESVYVNKTMEPIVHAIVPGFMEHILLMGFPREAMLWDTLRKVVDVKAVRLTTGSGGWLHAIVSIRKRSEGDARNAIMAAFTGHPSLKHVVVVDDDIDIDNPMEVEWAIATRFQATKDLVIIPRARGSTLDPSGCDGIIDKMGVDATKPLDKPKELFYKIDIP